MSSDHSNGDDAVGGHGEEPMVDDDGSQRDSNADMDDESKERSKRGRGSAEENGHDTKSEDGDDHNGSPGGRSEGDRIVKKVKREGDGKLVIKLKGLPWKVDEEDVKNFLSGVDLVMEDGIVIVEHGSYEAYVTVASEGDEKDALKKHGDKLGRRIVEVQKSSSEERDRRASRSSSGSREAGILRLRGLPYSASEGDIKAFFTDYGLGDGSSEKSVHFIMDHSGRPSGQAYVTFRCPEEARAAQVLDKEKIGERWVDIFMSSASELSSTLKGPERGGGGGRRGDYGGQRPMGPSGSGSADLSDMSNVVKVRGLPFDCTRADLLHFFQDADAKENGIFFVHRMDGKASGEAFVVFNSYEGVKKALQLDKEKMRDRWLDIFESNQNDLLSRVGMAVSLANKPDCSYTGVLKLRGLPFQASVADIKEFFSGFSLANHGIYITNGPDGRATGEAYVVMSSEAEAERACGSLNKKSIQNRWIELLQVSKGDLYTATVSSPIVSSYAGCPLYANRPMTCVRLRFLPPDVKEDNLFAFFHGLNVIGLYICRDHSGRSTGEAYAEFGSLDDCQQAMSRNRDRLNPHDRLCVEVHAVSKEDVLEMIEQEKRGIGGVAPGAGGYGMGAGAGYHRGGPGPGWGGGAPPGGYAAMAAGGHAGYGGRGGGYGGGWGGGGGGGGMRGGAGGYADRAGDRSRDYASYASRRDDRRW